MVANFEVSSSLVKAGSWSRPSAEATLGPSDLVGLDVLLSSDRDLEGVALEAARIRRTGFVMVSAALLSSGQSAETIRELLSDDLYKKDVNGTITPSDALSQHINDESVEEILFTASAACALADTIDVFVDVSDPEVDVQATSHERWVQYRHGITLNDKDAAATIRRLLKGRSYDRVVIAGSSVQKYDRPEEFKSLQVVAQEQASRNHDVLELTSRVFSKNNGLEASLSGSFNTLWYLDDTPEIAQHRQAYVDSHIATMATVLSFAMQGGSDA